MPAASSPRPPAAASPTIGTTTFRPFYTPVSFGALTGAFRGTHYQPVRKTPLHAWCEAMGAVFMEAGLWLRSAWFPLAGEDWRAAATREVMAVRQSVGICDVSTLGKIDLQGPDATTLLNRLYCNGFSTLAAWQGALWPDAARGWLPVR